MRWKASASKKFWWQQFRMVRIFICHIQFTSYFGLLLHSYRNMTYMEHRSTDWTWNICYTILLCVFASTWEWKLFKGGHCEGALHANKNRQHFTLVRKMAFFNANGVGTEYNRSMKLKDEFNTIFWLFVIDKTEYFQKKIKCHHFKNACIYRYVWMLLETPRENS